MTVIVGLRELSQDTADLVSRAGAGETVTVVVDGREVAELGPVRRDLWRTWVDVAAVFDGPPDADGEADRDEVDQSPLDRFDASAVRPAPPRR